MTGQGEESLAASSGSSSHARSQRTPPHLTCGDDPRRCHRHPLPSPRLLSGCCGFRGIVGSGDLFGIIGRRAIDGGAPLSRASRRSSAIPSSTAGCQPGRGRGRRWPTHRRRSVKRKKRTGSAAMAHSRAPTSPDADAESSLRHARKFRPRRSGWACFAQVRALRRCEMVALSLAGSGVVVTS